MKLTYLDRVLGGNGPAAIALHREATTARDAAASLEEADLFSRVVAPSGEYAFYPSGMTVGGTCWYRILPGFDGTDPISLATAVVEAADLTGEVALDRPVLIGWGQGATVALGVGLWCADDVRGVVCIDAMSTHMALLPPTILRSARRPGSPPVLLAGLGGGMADDELRRQRDLLSDNGVASTVWCGEGAQTQREEDLALADGIRGWLDGG